MGPTGCSNRPSSRPQRVRRRRVRFRYVEPHRAARTMLAACFSILSPIEGFASIAEQIVVGSNGLVPRVGRIDLDDTEFLLVPRCAMENRPEWSDDFTVPDKRELIFAVSCFAPCAITGNRKHSIFQAPNRHGVRAIGQYEIRRMADDLCSLDRQCARGLRIVPIETDHRANLGRPDIPHLKSRVSGRKEQRFLKKQMGLSIAPDKP